MPLDERVMVEETVTERESGTEVQGEAKEHLSSALSAALAVWECA